MNKNPTTYDIFEHRRLRKMKEKHPDWIWNRSDTHVILGVPGTIDGLRTPVEPGNSFSPGPGSYGVSTWIYHNNELHAPETKKLDELEWSFEDGHIPILCSKWNADDVSVISRLFTTGDVDTNDIRDHFSVRLENTSDKAAEVSFYLVIRSVGAAGGPVRALAYKDNSVIINDHPLLLTLNDPDNFGAVSYEESGKDISCFLKNGNLPPDSKVSDSSKWTNVFHYKHELTLGKDGNDTSWVSGALEYKLSLKPGESRDFYFICQVQANNWMLEWMPPLIRPAGCAKEYFESEVDKFKAIWKEHFSIELHTPDKRFTDAFYCQIAHLYMFSVHSLPRISSISYPLWWLRDGSYAVTALDKAGLHEFGKNACLYVKDKTCFGGFGSEADGPGQMIWIISEHYYLTRDEAFLNEMWLTIEKSADFIIKMMTATTPVKVFTENIIPYLVLEPNMDIPAIAAKDGLIVGRMDNHFPLIWVNLFSWMGLTRAADCARALGKIEAAKLYQARADTLNKAIKSKYKELFGKNDRDINSAFWPTGWGDKNDSFINEKYDEFWKTVRYPDGKHFPEPLWTYFEAGQAHNDVLRGHRDLSWVSIEYFLSTHTAPGLYTYHEGECDENSSLQWQRLRGWDEIRYITPHGWTAAEFFHLLRDCMIREDSDAVTIGSGIPENWLDSDFSMKNVPTYFGKVSFAYSAKSKTLTVKTENPEIKVKHELLGDVKIIRYPHDIHVE